LRRDEGARGGFTPGNNENEVDRGFAFDETDRYASWLFARGVNGELEGVDTRRREGVAGV